MFDIHLKAGREKPLLRGHPWIFSGAIKNQNFSPRDIDPGETVRVLDSTGGFVAWGAFSPKSQIKVRVWSRAVKEEINEDFFRSRLKKALKFRESLKLDQVTNALRLVHAESDGLPGLIVDQYADTIVVQFLSCGAEYWREQIVQHLVELTGVKRVYERSDAKVRELEGLPRKRGLLWGDESFELILIQEWDRKYYADIRQGQKTGFYLDQRHNRHLLTELARDCSVLDCFAYSGGFSIPAVRGGASHVTAVDSAASAIELGNQNVALNGLSPAKIDFVEGDVFQVLRKYRDKGSNFDLIILDPPKFAPTAAHAQKAARGYKDINLLAFKLLKPDGRLITFSCSGGVSEDLFQKIVAGAAIDAGMNARLIGRLGTGADHPVALSFPEGAYLKGFVIGV